MQSSKRYPVTYASRYPRQLRLMNGLMLRGFSVKTEGWWQTPMHRIDIGRVKTLSHLRGSLSFRYEPEYTISLRTVCRSALYKPFCMTPRQSFGQPCPTSSFSRRNNGWALSCSSAEPNHSIASVLVVVCWSNHELPVNNSEPALSYYVFKNHLPHLSSYYRFNCIFSDLDFVFVIVDGINVVIFNAAKKKASPPPDSPVCWYEVHGHNAHLDMSKHSKLASCHLSFDPYIIQTSRLQAH